MPPLPPSQNPVPGLGPQASPNSGATPQVSHTDGATPSVYSNQGHNPGQTLQGTQHGPAQQAVIPENSSPPIPAKNNIRNRLELDSVSPAVQRPNPMEAQGAASQRPNPIITQAHPGSHSNPMDTQVSPISPNSPSNKANFSYPSRVPPQGVPRQVHNIPQQQNPQQWGESWNSQQHGGYDQSNRPIPLRMGHDSQPPQNQPQKQPTLSNLKAAVHGIHVCSIPYSLIPTQYTY